MNRQSIEHWHATLLLNGGGHSDVPARMLSYFLPRLNYRWDDVGFPSYHHLFSMFIDLYIIFIKFREGASFESCCKALHFCLALALGSNPASNRAHAMAWPVAVKDARCVVAL